MIKINQLLEEDNIIMVIKLIIGLNQKYFQENGEKCIYFINFDSIILHKGEYNEGVKNGDWWTFFANRGQVY